jgi:hypothetical protein
MDGLLYCGGRFFGLGDCSSFCMLGFWGLLGFNSYMKTSHLVLKGILGNWNLFPAEYQFKECFWCLWVCGVMGCPQGWFRRNYPKWDAKGNNLRAWKMIIDEKIDIKNFLDDAMDFHAIKQLMVKSRHKILMPTLVMYLNMT